MTIAENQNYYVSPEKTKAIEIVRRWMKNDYLKLHGGEFTAQESRSLKAVLNAIIRQIEDEIKWP